MLFTIDGNPTDIEQLVEFARSRGITIQHLEGDDALIINLLPDGLHRDATLRDLKKLSIGHLRRMTLGAFMNPSLTPMSLKTKCVVLHYMIEHELSFADVAPQNVFTTLIESTSFNSKSVLIENGCHWLAMLPYLTEGQVRQFKAMGANKMKVLMQELGRLGIRLKR